MNTVVVTPGDEVAGRYRLEEIAGRGPMSEVWRAHDDTLERTVALKILAPTADLERFQREARAVASLSHENVMRVFDYGEDAAGPFMSLEWLPNGTLEDRLGGGKLPVPETAAIAHGIAAGLAHLHERGFVHRDLKPANVLFDGEGRPKLADFGLARSTGVGTLTEAGTVLGTAAYISPEQAAGEPTTAASDVYSFGVLLFRMLTGALPFIADDALALLDMHRNQPAPPVETLDPEAPPELAAVANAALQKDPAARPADGAALLAALGGAPSAVALAADADVTRVIPAAGVPAATRASRRGGALAIVLALVLLAGLGAVVAWAVTRPAPTAPAGVFSTGGTGHHHSTSLPTTTNPLTSTSLPTTTHAHTTTAHTTPAHTTTAHTTTAQTTTTTPTTTTVPTTTPTTTAGTTTAPATTPTTGQTTTT